MNWYKQSQSLGLTQTLLPSDFSTSLFLETDEAIDKLDMEDILDGFAQEKGYRSKVDYVLCSLYPEFEKQCRKYYEGKGKKLLNLIPSSKVKEIDRVMSHAVYFMYQQKQRLEPIQKDETLSVITPASEDVAITPRQIYTRDDVIQEREDLVPSMLRKKRR